MSVPKAIRICLKQFLGADCYVPMPHTSRLKSGVRVYRITGSYDLYLSDDGKIFYRAANLSVPTTEITRDNWEQLKNDTHISEWEFRLLERGPERTERELTDALAEKGHAVSVSIGARSGSPSSIVVRQLALPIQPGASSDSAVLGELLAISDALAGVRASVDDLSLRLRSLAVTITLRSGKMP